MTTRGIRITGRGLFLGGLYPSQMKKVLRPERTGTQHDSERLCDPCEKAATAGSSRATSNMARRLRLRLE
jgi:hypothetical protein